MFMLLTDHSRLQCCFSSFFHKSFFFHLLCLSTVVHLINSLFRNRICFQYVKENDIFLPSQCFAINDFGTSVSVVVNLREARLDKFLTSDPTYHTPEVSFSLNAYSVILCD